MEEQGLLQSNNDDEVLVRQADGSFKIARLSDVLLDSSQFVATAPMVQSKAQARPIVSAPPQAPQAPKPPVPQVVKTPPAQTHLAKVIEPPHPPAPPNAELSSVSIVSEGAQTQLNNDDVGRQSASMVERLARDVPEDLKARLKMLLISYFKGIRQEYAVRERLMQTVESGGLGWNGSRTDLFLQQLKKLTAQGREKSDDVSADIFGKASALPSAPTVTVMPPAPTSTSASASTLASSVSKTDNLSHAALLPELEPEMRVAKPSESPPQPKQAQKSPPVPAQSISAVAKEVLHKAQQVPKYMPAAAPHSSAMPPKPKSTLAHTQSKLKATPQPHTLAPRTSDDIRPSSSPILKIIDEKGAPPKVMPESASALPQKYPPHIAIPQTPAGKAEVRDITFKPRLVGPIEELKTLTLADFRRLSRDPHVAADKIHAKVELLGEESFEKKIKGALAWRASEVNQLYTDLVNESIKTGAPIQAVLSGRAARKDEMLAFDEFQAIMKLNSILRF